VNGKKARALRRIARELNLDPEVKCQPVGPIRHREAIADHGRTFSAGIVPRPFALGPCERRAYKEAKALYKGADVDTGPAPIGPVILEPSTASRAFKDQVVDSLKKQAPHPVLK